MDRNNKYYDIIESLIKNHKKFPGCEAILDDIMDDVYSHSEIIISSIKDENVIRSYLERIVSTSLVTVPKKLKFNKNVNHVVIGAEPVTTKMAEIPTEHEENVVKSEEPVLDEVDEFDISLTEKKDELKANTEYVDKMINLAEPAERVFESDIVQHEQLQDNSYEISSEHCEMDNDFTENIDTVDLEEVIPDNIVELLPEEDNKCVLSDNIETLEFNDNEDDLLDISRQEVDEVLQNETEEEPQTSYVEEINEEHEYQTLDDISNDDETMQEEILDEEVLEENNITSSDEDVIQPEEASDVLVPELDLSNDSSVEEINIEELSDFDDVDLEKGELFNSDDDNDNIEIEDNFEAGLNSSAEYEEKTDDLLKFSSVESNDLVLEMDETHDIELSDNFSDMQNFPEFSDSEDGLSIDEQSDEKRQKVDKNSSFIPSDFSCLYYEPKDILKDINSENIVSQIYTLNDSLPELNVLSVYNLKYKENLPISQIAEQLSMDESSVIEALNKIIDLV